MEESKHMSHFLQMKDLQCIGWRSIPFLAFRCLHISFSHLLFRVSAAIWLHISKLTTSQEVQQGIILERTSSSTTEITSADLVSYQQFVYSVAYELPNIWANNWATGDE